MLNRLFSRMDVAIYPAGVVTGLRPLSANAKAWFDRNLVAGSGQYIWMGPTLYVDHELAGPIIQGMQADGLEVR